MRTNPIATAIKACGGIVKTSVLLEVSNAAVYQWKKWGRMPNDSAEARARAEKLAKASGVPLLELLGFHVTHRDGGHRARPRARMHSPVIRCLPTSEPIANPTAKAA